jgi:hypothetical protein
MSDALLLSACCLFLISVVEPFLSLNMILPTWYQLQVETKISVSYWSYKAVVNVGNYHERLFFNDYWFTNIENFPIVPIVAMDIRMFLIIMFATQILTIALGSLSLGLKKEKTRLISFVLSSIPTFLMYKTYTELDGGLHFIKYANGYWLTYPSMILFLLSFTMSLMSHRKRSASFQELKSPFI